MTSMMKPSEQIRTMHQKFYSFWQENRAPDGSVANEKIRLDTLKGVLPNIVRIRKTEDGPKFTLIGTQVVEEYKHHITGLLVSEHPHEVCRATYISLIKQMEKQSSMVTCYGYFCYPDRRYLRTMETGFTLSAPDGTITGYLVLVTVDHSHYQHDMYLPRDPVEVISNEVFIQSQQDFDQAMSLYQSLSA